MDKYHVFSTDDMVHWKDHGEILNSTQVSWGRPEGGFMWAPDCAYKNGTYYFYFPHPSGTDWNNTWKIGVATSKKPASEFKDQGYIKGVGGFAMIDPCVFVDDDGQAYLFYGGGAKCQAGKLKGNMTEIDGEMLDMTGLEDFHEAAWVFKRKGMYYLTYADNNPRENQLRYAVSKNPLGPWEYKGVYLEPTGCDTSHGSVVEYKGQWYAFYHNKSISGQGNLRSICVDKLYFNADGTIRTVAQTNQTHKLSDHWTNILSDDYEKYWEIFVGAPHASVKGLEGVDPNSDGMNAKPLGLNNDPKKVFVVEKSGNEVVLHISGEIYGAFSSKNEYENYQLQLQFKWGNKTWEPRMGKEKDSGVLYHCNGINGTFWNAWMEAQEFQVTQGGCGDYYSMGKLLINIPSLEIENGKSFKYKNDAELRSFSLIHGVPRNYCQKAFDNEKPEGEWNTLDLICVGDTCLHIINGKVVMALFNPKMKNDDGKIEAHRKGKIQLQSEGAEVFYKNIKIKSIDKVPAELKRQTIQF